MTRKSERSKNKPIKYSPSQSIPFPEPISPTTPTNNPSASAMFSSPEIQESTKPCASVNEENLNELLAGLPETSDSFKQIFAAFLPTLLSKFDAIADRIVSELKLENGKLKAENLNLKKRLDDQHKKNCRNPVTKSIHANRI